MGFVQPDSINTERAFGRWVKARRTDQKMSQAELAAAISARGIALDASAISRIESGDRSIRLNEADAIALALGEALFSGPLADRLSEGTIVFDLIARAAERLAQLCERRDRLETEAISVDNGIDEASAALEAALGRIGVLDDDETNYLVGKVSVLANHPRSRELFDRIVELAEPHLSRAFVAQWAEQRAAERGQRPEAS